MINIKDFDSNLIKIDKILSKNIDIYYIRYIDYVKINSANPVYLLINKADVYIEERNGNKYLIYASTDKKKEVLTKYTVHKFY